MKEFLCKFASDICGYNYFSYLMDIIKAAIILGVTTLLANHYIKRIKNEKNLSEYGITRIKHHDASDNNNDSDKGSGNLSKKDVSLLFGRRNPKPTELCFFFITGYTFFENFMKKAQDLKELANNTNNCKVKILIGDYRNSRLYTVNPKDKNVEYATQYYYDIAAGNIPGDCFIDRSTAMVGLKSTNVTDNPDAMKAKLTALLQSPRGDHLSQILRLNELVSEANRENGNTNIEVRYFVDEYKVPYMIAKYNPKKDKDIATRVWTNFTNPIQEARKSINIYGEEKDGENLTFVDTAVSSFNYLWNRYEKTSHT